MFWFCTKCRSLYNLTKDVKSKQVGGRINDALNVLFEKLNANDALTEKDLKRIKGKDVLDDERFEQLNKKDQRKVISNIKSVDKNFFVEESDPEVKIGSNSAFFICKFCGNNEPIKPGTLIYSKNYNSANVSEVEDYTYAIYDQTLPTIKNYICKNKKCETHQDPSLKEAVFTKNSIDQLVYICKQCSTHWINSI